MSTFKFFGKRLKRLRKQRLLSQKELALLTGLDQGRISMLENGHFKCISENTLKKFEQALNCYFKIIIKY